MAKHGIAIQVFLLSVACDQETEEELNIFLRSWRIVSIHKELIRQAS